MGGEEMLASAVVALNVTLRRLAEALEALVGEPFEVGDPVSEYDIPAEGDAYSASGSESP